MTEANATDTKTYTTGELATLCGVSVRTIQYYDERGLLPPSSVTDGGRRIYSDADADRLRRIILLKSLGLKLADIKSFLESDAQTTVLRDILREQDARLAAELEERTAARARIAAMLESLDRDGRLPANQTPAMEDAMQRTGILTTWRTNELRPLYTKMLVVGLIIDAAEIAALIWGIMSGVWWPFVTTLVMSLIATVPLVRTYRASTAYACPHCREVFVPTFREWFFARHTPTTRKVTCTRCGQKDWCAEVSVDRLES